MAVASANCSPRRQSGDRMLAPLWLLLGLLLLFGRAETRAGSDSRGTTSKAVEADTRLMSVCDKDVLVARLRLAADGTKIMIGAGVLDGLDEGDACVVLPKGVTEAGTSTICTIGGVSAGMAELKAADTQPYLVLLGAGRDVRMSHAAAGSTAPRFIRARRLSPLSHSITK